MTQQNQIGAGAGEGCLMQILGPLIGIPLGYVLGAVMVVGLFWIVMGVGLTVGMIVRSADETVMPVLLMGIAALTGWLITRREKGIVAGAVKSICGPMAVALLALTLSLMLMNVLRLTVSYSAVAQAEEFLIDLRFAVTDAAHMPLWLFSTVILCLIAVTNVMHVRAVTVFVETKKRIAQFVAVLTVITSFTLFAQIPAGDLLARRYNDVMQRFELSLRREKAAVARAAAAEAVRDELQSLSPERRETLRSVVTRLHTASPGEAPDAAVAKILDGEGLRTPEPARGIVADYDPPRTRAAYAAAERAAAAEERKATEAERGAKEIVGEIVGAFMPELEGYGGKFIGSIIDRLAERLYEPWIDRLFIHEMPGAFKDSIRTTRNSAGAHTFVNAEVLQLEVNHAEAAAQERAQQERSTAERVSRRKKALDIKAYEEIDARLRAIGELVEKQPEMSDEKFADVLAYLDAVRAHSDAKPSDEFNLNSSTERWQWVKEMIEQKVKPESLRGLRFDPMRRKSPAEEHPIESHPAAHPIRPIP